MDYEQARFWEMMIGGAWIVCIIIFIIGIATTTPKRHDKEVR